MKSQKKKKKKIIGKNLETLLREARLKNDWSYSDVFLRLNDSNISAKTIKKWEYGLEYPNLDMIYKLSELYMIPSEEIMQAKSNSLEMGSDSINTKLIKRFCYMLNISIYTGIVLNILAQIFAIVFAFKFFIAACEYTISKM